ncbi:MAG: DUF4402 domain-containing protein [Acidobacteriota bacterium]|nr:DUF4402 domain-containing protein [Acidobacteriota bacterium]
MRRRALPRIAVAALLFLAGPARGQQNDASAVARIGAAVVPGLALQKAQDLRLGEFRPGGSFGTVEIDVPQVNGSSTGLRSATGGVTLALSDFSPAAFAVTGPSGRTVPFTVNLPPAITLVRVGGGETMTVDRFHSNVNPDCAPGAAAGSCPGSPYTVLVGATVHVPANQIAGRYVGSFTITVNQL